MNKGFQIFVASLSGAGSVRPVFIYMVGLIGFIGCYTKLFIGYVNCFGSLLWGKDTTLKANII